MSEEILINVTPRETRVAIIENGVLQEVFIERANKRGLVGNIYKGRVSRILPGMQAAFINIGLSRTAFLHASNITSVVGEEDSSVDRRSNPEDITQLLNENQEVLVQVIKDPLGSKGARLTMHITVPSRYLVFMPGYSAAGVSQRIEDEAERQRLKEIVTNISEGQSDGGYIVRTAAEGASESELVADMRFLRKLWESIQQRAAQTAPGEAVYEDLPLPMRIMRDLVNADVDKVRIDSWESYQRVVEFATEFIPHMVPRIEHYAGERPCFDLYSVEDELQKALDRKVQLKSGGYLIIDQTEAMTTIDVNTGAFVGHRNLEETIFKTNLEAAQSISRQLRLRNLGGIIIIDFIDMLDEEHKRQVMRALEKALERDRAKSYVTSVSELGLVQMTRKRTRESLEHLLCEPCPMCHGRGTVKTTSTVCYEIFREIVRESRQFEAQKFLVMASQEVVDLVLDEESSSLAELEEFIGKPIRFQVESLYTQEQFDVVLM
ncbi:MAG TPA: ribonuclease G [Gammaproteobacteria bacterium]|nr:ribonuclease G [Gammaproteobacteria bacterium]